MDVTEGQPVLTTNDLNVYAFKKNDSVVTDPDYTILLTNSDDFSRDVAINYQDGTFNLTIGGMLVAKLELDSSTDLKDNHCIAIYAAVSVKSNSYTNHYWSALNYVGFIKVAEE